MAKKTGTKQTKSLPVVESNLVNVQPKKVTRIVNKYPNSGSSNWFEDLFTRLMHPWTPTRREYFRDHPEEKEIWDKTYGKR